VSMASRKEEVGSRKAYAKINLDLRVLATREDGYHELSTVFLSIALHDTLTCRASDGPFALTCDVPGVPIDRSNLVWRAAERLANRAGRPLDGLAMHIEKRVPLRAGLGGGSADAAAALHLLAKAWGVEERSALVDEVAQEVGADVPFFFVGGTALGTGRGDALTPLEDFPRHDVLLILPPFGVRTADAYRWFDESRPAARGLAPDWRRLVGPGTGSGAWRPLAERFTNDLEAAVAARHPEIRLAGEALSEAGAVAAGMSGSGSATFGLFPPDADLERAANLVRRALTEPDPDASGAAAQPPWRILRTRTISRAQSLAVSRVESLAPGPFVPLR
jgi:4-diphosphocytidyl-2-C-methyl-D-erythritol kinase